MVEGVAGAASHGRDDLVVFHERFDERRKLLVVNNAIEHTLTLRLIPSRNCAVGTWYPIGRRLSAPIGPSGRKGWTGQPAKEA